MRTLLLAAVLVGIGCSSTSDVSEPPRPEMFGVYTLQTVNGEGLPFTDTDAGGVTYTFFAGTITLGDNDVCTNMIHWQYEWETELVEDSNLYECVAFVNGNTVTLYNVEGGGGLVLTYSNSTLTASRGDYQLVFSK